MESVKVFISYSHDSDAHSARVLALAQALRKSGLKVEVDQFVVRPPHGWERWCTERLRPENARFVLMICTPEYYAGVENLVTFDKRRGTFWEGALIHNYLYKERENKRFIPILFDDTDAEHVPDAFQQHRRYRLQDFDVSDPEYDDLYRELTEQPAVIPEEIGAVIARPPRNIPDVAVSRAAAPHFDLDRIYIYAPKDLIGREAETAIIEDAWARAAGGRAHPHVLAFVALAGEGKTSLVASFANALAARGWPGAQAAFAWSFYRQGSSEQAGASSDLFFAEALKFFRLPAVEGESGYEKGKRLARALSESRALLILDGLEPLQYPPNSPMQGRLKDDALAALLKTLATRNAGLCLATTRYEIEDLKGYGATAPQRELGGLSEQAGAALLARLGVKGSETERRALSRQVKGHALTLEIVGSYLANAHGGDIARRDRIKLETASAAKGGHAMRAMAAYEEWFESAGADGARALAMLRLTGLFDRAADAGCLGALWQAPAIAGLTEPLVNLSEEERNLVLSRLEAAKLLTVKREGAALLEIDAHPLLREYFAVTLRGERPDTWREAHRRLYTHLTTTTKDKPAPTLDDLQPLYQAVVHGCAAGLWQETCDKVYNERICRSGEFYSTKKLGAFGADLGAIASFFVTPWRRVSPHLTPADQAWLLNMAGFHLRALGRLVEAREPMRAGLEMRVAQEKWISAAIDAGNLSELELTFGDVKAAIRLGETAVAHADKSEDAFLRISLRISKLSTHADALHQAGERVQAEALFARAETMQAERQPAFRSLYSLAGFRYCDLKLGGAERAAWRRLVSTVGASHLAESPSMRDVLAECAAVGERATQTLKWANAANAALLTISLDHLTLARAALYAAVLRGEAPPGDHVNEAVDVLRRAGTQDHLPLPLLTRALHRAVTENFDGAREDLDEAFEIAERGPMRLHLADIHLHRARLFGLLANRPAKYPWASPQDDLAEARKLVAACGYGRRTAELADAEAALRALSG